MYQPIENYGLIGNMRTAALVGRDGSIDWYCWPRFDSPSVFGALLDDKRGGRFRLQPRCETKLKQLYWPDTNVLITRFLSVDGVAEIEDYMPLPERAGDPIVNQIVRRVRCVRGEMPFLVHCEPAFDYGRASHTAVCVERGVCFQSPALTLELHSDRPLSTDGKSAHAEFVLREGEQASFVLTHPSDDGSVCAASSQEWFEATVKYWRTWIARSQYHGRWREMVNRSALVLKLLTYEPTGAIIAAPTTSLPERIGGERNWDYRYTWIRDASFILYSFMRLGFTDEAHAFMGWIHDRFDQPVNGEPLQIVYGIDGRTDLQEISLDHWEGYRGSRPVRIGNAAHEQLQLDIYGELLDSVYLYNKYGAPISYDAWVSLQRILEWVGENWQRPDDGIWEVRGGRQQFVYSKVMCWVAMDRGIRLADKRSFPCDRVRWQGIRDRIYQDVMTKGWDAKRQSFTQTYDNPALDASALLMPLVFFLAPSDERMLRTVEAIRSAHTKGGLFSDGLVYRYNPQETKDGLSGYEGTFNICSFWLVEALTRAGRTDRRKLGEAVLLFERMLGYANHLGLYGEQTGFGGEALGNFPQGFTHLALISAAYNLDRALG